MLPSGSESGRVRAFRADSEKTGFAYNKRIGFSRERVQIKKKDV